MGDAQRYRHRYREHPAWANGYPDSRRRVYKLARETVTLDHLSRGRLILGVGLGIVDDFTPFCEESDPRTRARLLDEGLNHLIRLWAGEFQPRPIQKPRIPIWVAAGWPHQRPVRRAARWDGLFPIDLPGPEVVTPLIDQIRHARQETIGAFDIVVETPPGADPGPWETAGATWVLTSMEPPTRLANVRQVIDAGP